MIKCEFENGNKASLRHVCADVLVLKDDKILLQLRSEKLLMEPGKWALAGGFIDLNETVVEGAEREVPEETGWKVRDIELLRVLDDPKRRHDPRQNIVFLYAATATEKVGEGDWETDELRWFALTDLPTAAEMAFDHLESINYYLGRVAQLPQSKVE